MRLVAVAMAATIEADNAVAIPRQPVDPPGRAPVLIPAGGEAVNQKHRLTLAGYLISNVRAVLGDGKPFRIHGRTIAKLQASVYDGVVLILSL
jgi:hypothetical protein